MSYTEQEKNELLSWLETIMDEPVQTELNEHLLSDLFKLHKNFKEEAKDAELVTDFKLQQISEYEEETKRMENLLKDIPGLYNTDAKQLTTTDQRIENIVQILAGVSDMLGLGTHPVQLKS